MSDERAMDEPPCKQGRSLTGFYAAVGMVAALVGLGMILYKPLRLRYAIYQVGQEVARRSKTANVNDPNDVHRIMDPEVIVAINTCRDAKLSVSIPYLVGLADAVDGTLASKPPWNLSMGASPSPPPGLLFPAARALVVIGQEAVPEILKALATEDASRLRAWFVRQTLADIVGLKGAATAIEEKERTEQDEAKKSCLRANRLALKENTSAVEKKAFVLDYGPADIPPPDAAR